MTKLYSSTFISIVLSFLMFLSYKNQPIVVVQNPVIPNFTYIFEESAETDFENIRIEIFDDLNCPDCTNFTLRTLSKIKNLEQETDEIDLHLYFVPDMNSEVNYQAALSLKCASDQEQFFGMHEKLHKFEEGLTKSSLIQFSKELELNTDAFNECLKENVYQKQIEEDVKYAAEKNISVKPTILVNNYRLVGNQPFENIQKIINRILKEKMVVTAPLSDIADETTDLELELEFGAGIDLPVRPSALEINPPKP